MVGCLAPDPWTDSPFEKGAGAWKSFVGRNQREWWRRTNCGGIATEPEPRSLIHTGGLIEQSVSSTISEERVVCVSRQKSIDCLVGWLVLLETTKRRRQQQQKKKNDTQRRQTKEFTHPHVSSFRCGGFVLVLSRRFLSC